MGIDDGKGAISNSISFKTTLQRTDNISKREREDALKFISFLLPVTADNRVLEVNTQRLGPSQALEPLPEGRHQKAPL